MNKNRMKTRRFFLWPIVLLIYLNEALYELWFRIWLALWVTANWTLGDRHHIRLATIVLRQKAKQLDRKWRHENGSA